MQDVSHRREIAAAYKSMTQRSNVACQFGRQYQEYWENVSRYRIQKRKEAAAEDITTSTIDTMRNITHEVSGQASKRARFNPTDQEEYPLSMHVMSPQTTVHNLGLSELNIIGFTEKEVYEYFQQELDEERFKKLNVPVDAAWVSEDHCQKLLDAVSGIEPDKDKLLIAIRTPVIDPRDFRAYKHRDLRAVEAILNHWMDMMCSPVNPFLSTHGERTSVIYGVIHILNTIFLQHNELVNLEWIEVQVNNTKKHKWDGAMNMTSTPKTTVMLIEFAGGSNHEKDKKNTNDTQRIYRNALRIVNEGRNANSMYPRVFTVLAMDKRIHFESLVHVDNSVYVRSRSVTIQLPTTPTAFQLAAAALPKLLT